MVLLIPRQDKTCRLKLGARRRKEKGGREREVDHREVSQVMMEKFFRVKVCQVHVIVKFITNKDFFLNNIRGGCRGDCESFWLYLNIEDELSIRTLIEQKKKTERKKDSITHGGDVCTRRAYQ